MLYLLWQSTIRLQLHLFAKKEEAFPISILLVLASAVIEFCMVRVLDTNHKRHQKRKTKGLQLCPQIKAITLQTQCILKQFRSLQNIPVKNKKSQYKYETLLLLPKSPQTTRSLFQLSLSVYIFIKCNWKGRTMSKISELRKYSTIFWFAFFSFILPNVAKGCI